MKAQGSCLVMKRREGESIVIGTVDADSVDLDNTQNIEIIIRETHQTWVKIVILSPRYYPIVRKEIAKTPEELGALGEPKRS